MKKLVVGILAHVDAGKQLFRKRFYIPPEGSKSLEELITKTLFLITTSWSANAE